MRPVVQLLALWLAALWLPLTMHCQLAALHGCDEASLCCQNHGGCSGGDDCQSDVCNSIETGNCVVNRDLLTAPAPSCEPIGWSEPVTRPRGLTSPPTLSETTGAPPGWNRVWQFAFRAAPAPRAPSAVS
ncbi:MAG: hypothetical protein WCJ14_02465 [Verrucomicrobiota bacterium]